MNSPFTKIGNRRIAVINVNGIAIGFLLTITLKRKENKSYKEDNVFHCAVLIIQIILTRDFEILIFSIHFALQDSS